jgi:hypothetical protein
MQEARPRKQTGKYGLFPHTELSSHATGLGFAAERELSY